MKKLLLAAFALFTALGLQAADKGDIDIANLKLERKGDNVEISFLGTIPKDATKSNYSLTVTPVLFDRTNHIELTSIIVEGRKAKIANQRLEMSQGVSGEFPKDAVVVKAGKRLPYMIVIPYVDWIQYASLRLDKYSEGCCTVQQLQPVVIAKAIHTAPERIIETVELKPLVPNLKSPDESVGIANVFADMFPFLEQNGQANTKTLTIKEMKRDALVIRFRQGERIVDKQFKGNDGAFMMFMGAIRTIENSGNSRVAEVVIAGYASPEGSYEFNDKLALARANALKNFVLQNTGISANQIRVISGAEDWDGLRDAVASSNMPSKNEVIRIIDNVPIWDASTKTGREKTLMDLRGGEPYRYMYKNIFPDLRNANYMRVYYESSVSADVNMRIVAKAQAMMAQGDYARASAILEAVENDERAFNTVGANYMMLGDFDKAKEFLMTAVQNGDKEAYSNLTQIIDRERAANE